MHTIVLLHTLTVIKCTCRQCNCLFLVCLQEYFCNLSGNWNLMYAKAHLNVQLLTNAMVGRHNSVAMLMQQAQPGIVLFHCICHSLHLAASKASAIMPTALEFLIRESHKWFSASPKRSRAYKELYQVMEGEMPKKIPGHSETRWLAHLAGSMQCATRCSGLLPNVSTMTARR